MQPKGSTRFWKSASLSGRISSSENEKLVAAGPWPAGPVCRTSSRHSPQSTQSDLLCSYSDGQKRGHIQNGTACRKGNRYGHRWRLSQVTPTHTAYSWGWTHRARRWVRPRKDAQGGLPTRVCFINPFPVGRHIPQGLKPACLLALGGPAEAVPFPKPIYETRYKHAGTHIIRIGRQIARCSPQRVEPRDSRAWRFQDY